MVKRTLVFLAVPLLLLLTPARSQQDSKAPVQDTSCLQKEVADYTRLIFADLGRMKVGLVVEDITWSDD